MKKLGFSGLILGIAVLTGIKAWAEDLKIHVINVGQGDSTLIVSPSGKKILIDAGKIGKGSGSVLPYLNSLGIDSLHYIFASHYHPDHIGGLVEVVNGLGGDSSIVYAAYDRGGSFRSKTFTDYVKAIGAKRRTISAGHFFDLGDGVTLTCVASNGSIRNARVYAGTDENTLSVVLILSYNRFQMYFGGDSTVTMELFLAPFAGNVDVYKVSHHGRSTGSSQMLLSIIKPEVSILSVGNGNIYRLPNPETITRLVNSNNYIYQTENGAATPPFGKGEVANGNFIITTDGFSYTIGGADLVTATRLTDEGAPKIVK
jgi:beta-lactamase superfamily II metal-dependent hydrolase